MALLQAAEELAAAGGLDAVGVRSAAAIAGTTTRAVYTVFGSREQLIEGLAERSYSLLLEQVAGVPQSGDAVDHLIDAAVLGFRRFAVGHPQLFRLFFVGVHPAWRPSETAQSARQESYGQLISLVRSAKEAGLGPGHSTGELVLMWDAACCGLALREVCGGVDPNQAEQIWRDTLTALVRGLGRA